MKLSISNIAWDKEYDEEIYDYISKSKLNAIEIAPTRLIEEKPYEHLEEAKNIANKLYKKYNLTICSMQSIWYGRQEKIFESDKERKELIDYTKKAIDFSDVINCKNLVFGCPKNRVINNIKTDYEIALKFFKQIGDYAKSKNTYFSIEPNPTIYNTNFINATEEALQLVKELNNEGIKINLDLGTIIQNNEDINVIKDNINFINHIHISEPNLEYIQYRNLHKDLIELLKDSNYNHFISIEMKKQNNIQKVKETIEYISDIV